MSYFPTPFHLPPADGPFAAYWAAARDHRLAIQRCTDCHAWRHPPGPMCWACGSRKATFEAVSGRGNVLTYTIVHQELLPELAGAAPYNVVVVALSEMVNVHIVGNVIDVAAGDLTVGMTVEAVFEDVTPDITLPRFRRA